MPTTPATATHSSSNGTAEAIMLELVDENGTTIGTAEKLAAHQAPGQLHRAFSVFLFDEQGRLLSLGDAGELLRDGEGSDRTAVLDALEADLREAQ